MATASDNKLPSKIGVWLRYRSAFSNEVKSVFMSGVQANRVVHRFNKPRFKQRLGYLQVQGVYEAVIPNNITLLRGKTDSDTRRAQRFIPTGHTERTVRDSFQRMSFHAAKLDNAVLVFCPVTGICGTLEMPSLPIALVYHHPLSATVNALTLMRAISDERTIKRMERQVYAGTLLSLLRGKRLLRDTEGETTAAECNMVLQAAGNSVLHNLCAVITRLWDNPNVWNKVPALNVDWKVHAATNYGGVSIAQTLQAFTNIVQNTLEPLSMSAEDQGRYLTARRERAERGNVPSYIKVHSASAVQARNVKDSKTQARSLYDNVAKFLPVVLQARTSKVIKDLMVLPNTVKAALADALEESSDNIAPLQAATVLELASLIRGAKTEHILSEIGSFINEVSPIRTKSIAEILEDKRIRREEKQGE